ncbi:MULTISPECIES: carbohydrate ABC transporter permease [Leucobacter]|uniref:N-acetylglucosamine transport system permease protein n=1 Tax=Leucobacter aridicollis TaxID=283878 RepID=A0A852R4Z1_9MICO|nr:carbohydrate ABC transporter permease [Leucobacter aridicollis]NYD27847.1 N-acetylglucosamine transport system permease protein [Leucobacter aridicollis]
MTSSISTPNRAALTPTRAAGPRARRKRASAPSERLVGIGSQAVLVIWTVVIAVPLLWTVMSSFKSSREILASPFALPSSWSFTNYATAWADARIGEFFMNTLVVVGGALALTMLLGAMCAYALARFEFPGRTAIRNLILAGLTFPVFLAVVPLFFVVQQFGLMNSLAGLIVTYTAYALPFTVLFLTAFFERLPHEIAEAAAIDGASQWRTFFSVMLPMAGPGMSAIALLNFVGLWNQYLLPVILITDPSKSVLTQGIQVFAVQAGFNVDFGALFAAAVMTILPVLIVYVIFQKRLLASVSQGALK